MNVGWSLRGKSERKVKAKLISTDIVSCKIHTYIYICSIFSYCVASMHTCISHCIYIQLYYIHAYIYAYIYAYIHTPYWSSTH